jgi:hypothetical protein
LDIERRTPAAGERRLIQVMAPSLGGTSLPPAPNEGDAILVQLQYSGEIVIAAISGFGRDFAGERFEEYSNRRRVFLRRTYARTKIELPVTPFARVDVSYKKSRAGLISKPPPFAPQIGQHRRCLNA